MRSETLLKPLSCLLLIAICFLSAKSYSQSNINRLHQVKKIYLEPTPNVKEEIRIEPYLKVELEKRGFETVNALSEADAILSLVNAQGEIVLDSDEDIPRKSIYQYQLALPCKAIIWKAKIKFVSKPSITEENEYVAQVVAGKLAKKFGAK